jgi:predicted DNA-binding transcriptional regulator YafY
VNYLSLTSGSSSKTLCPLALADTGLRWHLRAYDRERARFADFALTRIVKAKSIDHPIPVEEQIESDVQWARLVHIELVPHPNITHPKAIEADFQMRNGVITLDLRAPLVGYVLRRWSVDCTTNHLMDPKTHHLWLRKQAISSVACPWCGPTRSGARTSPTCGWRVALPTWWL